MNAKKVPEDCDLRRRDKDAQISADAVSTWSRNRYSGAKQGVIINDDDKKQYWFGRLKDETMYIDFEERFWYKDSVKEQLSLNEKWKKDSIYTGILRFPRVEKYVKMIITDKLVMPYYDARRILLKKCFMTCMISICMINYAIPKECTLVDEYNTKVIKHYDVLDVKRCCNMCEQVTCKCSV